MPIFISHASADAATANVLVDALERAGHPCWIAPRDVTPGALYADEIVRAISDASLVVLVLSRDAVASAHVGKELERASSKRRRIIAVRTDAAALTPAFEYFLSESQWIEVGKGGTEAAAAKLCEAVRRHLGSDSAAAPVVGRAAPTPVVSRPRTKWLAMAVAAALLLGSVGVYWAMNRTDAVAGQSSGIASLAVLPFADLSAEQDQEYFSDGLAEELLNSLAQIKDLRVSGRTSSFSFKGKNVDLREIGRQLGVANILEGSVRKSGNQLRITAQLVNAVDGTQRWSKSFDRELSDVFAVQEEIASAVSDALSVSLDVGEMSRSNGGTTDVAAYDKYLQAQALWNRGGQLPQFRQASQLFREALALDPRFSRAWHGLHRSVEQETVLGANSPEAGREMQQCIDRLLELSPNAWWTQSVLTATFIRQRKWAEAEAAITAALAASPRPELSLSYGLFLQRVGRGREAVGHIARAVEAEPLSRTLSVTLQVALIQAGRLDEAGAEYQRGKGLDGNIILADVFELWRVWSRKPPDKQAVEAQMRATYGTRRGAMGITPENWNDTQAAIAALRGFYEQDPNPGVNYVAVADIYGQTDIVLTGLRNSLVEHNGPQLNSLWLWNGSGWRSDPRFKSILQDLGLVDYFRSSGKWPDHCAPVGTGDFECR